MKIKNINGIEIKQHNNRFIIKFKTNDFLRIQYFKKSSDYLLLIKEKTIDLYSKQKEIDILYKFFGSDAISALNLIKNWK